MLFWENRVPLLGGPPPLAGPYPGGVTVPKDLVQGSFDDLGRPLADVTFVVVDVETTGTHPATAALIEVGAVRLRDGQVLDEFTTLVNPHAPVPASITLLTGITTAMVESAPSPAAALSAFLDFAGFRPGTVLVAHNAPFDVRFLKAACARHGIPWPSPAVLDTLQLARRLVPRGEVRNHRLDTLARVFGAHPPAHRALDDARATADVLRGLVGRLRARGVDTWEELRAFRSPVTSGQRSKRHLADGIPEAPGVYVFEDASGDPLYVGKSVNLRARVRSYFTAAEQRGRIKEMVGRAVRVQPIVCATAVEAEVRELRLIAARKPPYNRRSRHPERAPWLVITAEEFPRLAVVRQVGDNYLGALGPFSSSRTALLARDALHQAFPVRQCTHRITPPRPDAACALAEMGRCGAPCTGAQSAAEYAAHVQAVAQAMTGDVSAVVAALTARIDTLARELRYEEAALHRDRLSAFLAAAVRTQRVRALSAVPHLVAARPAGADWEVCVVRYGRLAGSACLRPGADPHTLLRTLVRTAESVPPPASALPRADAAETECLLRWLEASDVRLLEVEGSWVSPVGGAERYRQWIYRHTPA
ncbi:DEDD exonuclease domain-containing protein [Thermobifida fusca]|uniref:DEDD exonuclease domain-containing protein n=1 Tax=Thermobifida fusca TaxID=2021 RepID=UPI001878FBF9|nr:DEDD exonuclease domain-containing protein [Thermobifida fusca]QOS57686.1 DEDD exonuclease domain-containing protein [Thermobifida fusca]